MNTKKYDDISKEEAVSELRVIINKLLEVISKDESKDESKSITYISGYNDGLTDVVEYLLKAHGGDTFVSKAELIGHINASIKTEGGLDDD